MDFQSLAKKYSPIVFLHPEEKYFPCPIEDYVDNCSLWNSGKEVIPLGEMNIEKLPLTDEKWNLKVSENYYTGEEKLETVPYYVHIIEKDKVIQIIYVFIYAYNGSLYLCNIKKCGAGSHQADAEHMTVEVNKNDGSLNRVYFAAHGTNDGKWVSPKDLEYMDGRILVYSAKHSHASYNKKGEIVRCLGIVSDYTGKGKLWSPNYMIYIDDETRWVNFKGYLGFPNHVKSLGKREWWKSETEKSTNWFCRVFCICY